MNDFDSNNKLSKMESFLKTVSRFAIVYVIALAVCSLVSFSVKYRYFCAIAPAIVAGSDLIDQKIKTRKLFNSISANSEQPESASSEVCGPQVVELENGLLKVRRIAEEFAQWKSSVEAELSSIRAETQQTQKMLAARNKKEHVELEKGPSSPSELAVLRADLAQVKKIVKRNIECLDQHNRLLNEINDIQYKISAYQSVLDSMMEALDCVKKLEEQQAKNASDIVALTKLFHQPLQTGEHSVSLSPAQVSLTMKTIDMLEGHDFEIFCADLLEKSGYQDVSVTKKSGDQGVDVLATNGGIKYAFQCKCYSSELGNKPVQEVHAGKDMYGCQIGVVITNSFFTNGAKSLAAATGVLLWDRNVLQTMVSRLK